MSQAARLFWQSRLAPELLEKAEEQEIPFNTGSPPFPVHAAVKTAITERGQSITHLDYPPTNGSLELREVIAAFNREHLQLPHTADQILITYGALQAVSNILGAAVGPGDEVLLPAPFWFQFSNLVRQTGAREKIIQTYPGNNYRLTPKLLASAITPASRVLVFTSPNNPSGAIYSQDELAALAQVIQANPGLLVISDEVYNLLLLDGSGRFAAPSLGAFPAIADRVFVVNSLAKNQAMSGLRVGYAAITNAHWLARITSRQRFSSLGVNLYLQAGAQAGVLEAREIVGSIVGELIPRRHKAIALLGSIPRFQFQPPEAAYYFWVDIRGWYGCRTPAGNVIRDDTDLAVYLRDSVKVAVVDGTSCGMPGYFRITYALPDPQLEEGVARIKRALADLRCE
jgi:aspartate aminotransferase